MNFLDLLFSPKGTIKPQPFAIVVIGIYAINLLAGSILDGGFIKRAGMWPYLALQMILTWIWFVAHAKRLRDAGRGYVVAACLAFIYAAGIILMINLVAGSTAPVTETADPNAPKVTLIGTIIAVLFINTLFTGDFFLISLLIFLILGVPLVFALIVVIYSIVTATRTSLTPELSPKPQISAFKP